MSNHAINVIIQFCMKRRYKYGKNEIKSTKLVAKILSLAMITTMMSGYVAPPKEVKADTFNSSYSYEVNTQATEVEAATYNVVQSASNVVNSSDSLEKRN